MTEESVIIDTDPGVDDVLALLYAFKSRTVNVRAVVTSHGNTSLENVDANLRACLEVMRAERVVNESHNKGDKNDNNAKNDKSDKSDNNAKNDKSDKSDNNAKNDKSDKNAKNDMNDKSDKNEVVWIVSGSERPLSVANTMAEHVHGKGGLSGLTLDTVKKMVGSFLRRPQHAHAHDNSVDTEHTEHIEHAHVDTEHTDVSDCWFRYATAHDFPPSSPSEPLFLSTYKSLLDSAPPHSISIIVLGPLTNLAHLFLTHPSSFHRIKHIFIMGGAFFQPGNITPLSEFNIFTDPHAASLILSNPLSVPITVVPLNVTEKVRLRHSTANKVVVEMKGEKRGVLPDFVWLFLKPYFESMVDIVAVGGEATLAMHDPYTFYSVKLCMVVMACPHIVTRVSNEYVFVETEGGVSRGMTFTDRRRWVMKQPTSPFDVPVDRHDESDVLVISTDAHRKSLRTREGVLNGEVRMEKKGGRVRVVEQVDADMFFSEYMRVVFGVEWRKEEHAWQAM